MINFLNKQHSTDENKINVSERKLKWRFFQPHMKRSGCADESTKSSTQIILQIATSDQTYKIEEMK